MLRLIKQVALSWGSLSWVSLNQFFLSRFFLTKFFLHTNSTQLTQAFKKRPLFSKYTFVVVVSFLFCQYALTSKPFFKLIEYTHLKYGEQASLVVEAWADLIVNGPEEELEQLHRVNVFFNNNIVFTHDQTIWKQADYWSTPIQTMAVQAGDCEDFSIAKYFTLLKLGIPSSKLRLTYVKAQLEQNAQAHMVLAYYKTETSEPLILDNIVEDILPASQRPDLTPVYSFNVNGLWLANNRRSLSSTPESRLSQWHHVLKRMQHENFHIN